jgi:signal transduction histidine kinase
VVELVNESIDEMQRASQGSDVEVIRNFMDIRLLAFVDGEAVKRAIQQLLEIVFKYLGKSEGLDRPSIEMKLIKVKDRIEISISGSQLNIPEDLRRVFSSVDFSSKTLGYGFSLIVARKIVEAHNGQVELKGENGGHGFLVLLPAEDV